MRTPEVLARLKGVQGGNGHWKARCPSHDDRTPSLSISEGQDGRVMLKCHAGCETSAVVAAIGLELRDLFDDTSHNGGSKSQIVAEYPYHDEDGTHLFDVVRKEPKGFFQRNANGEPRMKGVRLVPYRLPQLLEAVKADRTIFVVEGEKDVQSLVDLGLVATTNAGGAGKWKQEYNGHFPSARVVLLPDNDDAGRAHAADVARQLFRVAKDIRIVELPGVAEKGDVSDWLGSGGTVAALKQLVKATPVVTEPPASAAPSSSFPASPDTFDEMSDAELGVALTLRAKPELPDAALAGPIGEAVAICAPECEAAPVSILLPALVIFGCMMGRRVTQDIGGTIHYHNLFGMLVGDTGEGRKGTGNAVAHRVMRLVDAPFMTANVAGGLSSGEGVIGRVADPKAREGVALPPRDTRLHIAEEEAGTVFTRMKRDGNSLSGVLRQAWDGRTLSTLTRKDDGGLIAKEPHISCVMQVTGEELKKGLGDIELVNGFMNRFLVCYTERVRLLPFGRPVDPVRLGQPVAHLQAALQALAATDAVALGWAPAAIEMYGETIYPSLRPLPGRLAAMTARGAPIIRRLAGIYCVSRGDFTLSVDDLTSAQAIWDYSVASIQYVYGGGVLSALAQRMLDALTEAGDAGLTLTALRIRVAGGQKTGKPEWDAALVELQQGKRVHVSTEQTPGRSKTTLKLAQRGNKVNKGGVEAEGGFSPLISPSTEPLVAIL